MSDVDLKTLSENFDKLNAEIAAAKKTMQGQSTGLIEAAVQQLFDACPEIGQVHWTQFTPYLNDGEACEFSVGEMCWASIEDVEEGDIDSYDSTTIFSQKDLDKARADYHTAELYEADPAKWRAEYIADYTAKHGRAPWNPDQIAPYPSSTVEARERIDVILASLEKFDAATVERIQTSFKAFTDMMSKVPEDIMEAVYGDHAMVTITRDGTQIDEYNHD